MKKTFENLKGTYDYLPEKQILREKIKSILQETFIKYAYLPIETPIICSYDLLSSKYSENADILNEIYKLSDQGERKLGLRYDLTITFSKLISSNKEITLPFKRYEIGKVYRDGPVKTGRNREFTQCDVDSVGIKSLLAEAEYMTMISDVFGKLNLEIEIEYNNRKLLTGIIEDVFENITEDKIKKTIMIIDKLKKLTKEDLLREFTDVNMDLEKVEKLLDILNLDFSSIQKIYKNTSNENIKTGIKEITELNEFLKESKVKNQMVFTPNLARGIDIYTGTVWEVFVKNRKVNNIDFTSSIAGGGRYDKIITSFIDDGNIYPAVGMSFGLDVIYEVIKMKNKITKINPVDIYIIPIDTEKESFFLATNLRNLNLKVDIDMQYKKLKKSLTYADKNNIPYVIILGEDELNKKIINLKCLPTGKVYQIDLTNLNKIVEIVTNQDLL